MVSAKQLLSTIEAVLLVQTPPTAAQRVELIHAIRLSLPSLKSLLSYPAPNASDKAQVQSKEVRLPDAERSHKVIAYDTSLDAKEHMLSLCGELVSVLERLELLSEDKTGHKLEVFRRLARSLKEMSIQKLSS